MDLPAESSRWMFNDALGRASAEMATSTRPSMTGGPSSVTQCVGDGTPRRTGGGTTALRSSLKSGWVVGGGGSREAVSVTFPGEGVLIGTSTRCTALPLRLTRV